MAVIPPVPMPAFKVNSVGKTVAEPTLNGLVGSNGFLEAFRCCSL